MVKVVNIQIYVKVSNIHFSILLYDISHFDTSKLNTLFKTAHLVIKYEDKHIVKSIVIRNIININAYNRSLHKSTNFSL